MRRGSVADRSERIIDLNTVSAKTLSDVDCAFPGSLREALEIMADESLRGRPLAGGTDLMVQWESGVLPMPSQVVSLKHLPELNGIEETDADIVVGAGVTHMRIRRSPLIQTHLPSLAAAAATIGGYQIQTMGTIGGSVANASPAGDLAPSLMITDGAVVVASVRGEREVPVNSFWTGYRKIDLQPDELIVRFRLPKMPVGHREYWRKIGPRRAQAISKVMGSCRGCVQSGEVKSFRVAMGSVAPTCMRLTALEQWVVGQEVSDAFLDEVERRASDIVQPIADIRSTAEYRKWVAGRIVRGFMEELRAG